MGLLGYNVPTLQFLDCVLRLFAIPFSVASIWLTVTNQQSNSDYGDLKFSNLTGLEYLVWISVISAGYAILAAVSLWIKCLVSRAWVFFVSDQVVAYLMITSMATLWEILYLVYNGDQEVTWSEACTSYGRFCGKLKLILALQIIVFCCFLILSVISAYRLFSRFAAPFAPPKETGEEMN